MRRLLWAGPLFAVSCSPMQPPSWPEGGAPLAILPARWERGEADAIEIRADGSVVEDGSVLFVVDRAGRIVDEDHEPLAILLPDGSVVSGGQRLLGQIGVTNAAPPWSSFAWLSVRPDGTVTVFDEQGDRGFAGRWQGCQAAALRTCTLVSHLVFLRNLRPPPAVGVGFGMGFGFGVGLGY